MQGAQIDPMTLSQLLEQKYDLGIGVVGYEVRASFAPLKFGPNCAHRVALAYGGTIGRSYLRNREYFSEAGFQLADLEVGREGRSAETEFTRALNEISKSTGVRIAIDISSMSRSVLAALLAVIAVSGQKISEVAFTYSMAKYEPPPTKYPPLLEFGAVHPYFGGAPLGPEKPTALIMGLGYEAGRSIAAFSRLDPGEAWLLLPNNPDKRHNAALLKANDDLLKLSQRVHRVRYDVNDPGLIYMRVRALISGLISENRVVLIPSGPKIAALMCFFAALEFHPLISVWRSSSGPLEPSFYRNPTGEVQVVRLRVSDSRSAMSSLVRPEYSI